MTCEIVRDLIPMYIDKTASEAAMQEVGEHLEFCEECRKFKNSCERAEKKLFGRAKDKIISKIKRERCDISELDHQYAMLSKKLKKRKLRQTLIGIGLMIGMLTYIVFDIVAAVKRKNKIERY